MESFKGNSDAGKVAQPVEQRHEEPITTNVKVKNEESFIKKIFVSDLKTTTKSVTNDVIIPGAKNLIINILKKGIDYLFTGVYSNSSGPTNYSGIYGGSKNVTFSPHYTTGPASGPMFSPVPKSSIYSINEVTFPDRGPAEEVLFRMKEIIAKYGMVSVLDFYDLINIKTSPTDNKYGWKDLTMASVVRAMDGYKISFPKVMPLE